MYVPKKQKVAPRPEIRRAQLKSFLQGFVKVIFIGATGLAIIMAIAIGTRKAKHSEKFRIERVEVVGNYTLTKQTVFQYSGLTRCEYIHDLDLSEIADKIRRHPDLESVSVKYDFPKGIKITVKEREPLAILVGADGTRLPVDKEGYILSREKLDQAAGKPQIMDSGEVPVCGRQCLKQATISCLNYLWVISNFPDRNFLTIRTASLKDPACIDVSSATVDHIMFSVEYTNDAVAKVFEVLDELGMLKLNAQKIDARFEDVAVVSKPL